MPASPVNTFPTDLDDATKWHVVRGVPVFKPHTRVLPEFKDPTGKVWPEVKIAVTERDLPYIADATNKAGPQPMRCGHVVQDPTYPEKNQPRVEGWEKNHGVGRFSQDGGKTWEPCVTADLYYRVESFDEVGPAEYPFRSVDYDFQTKRLTGLALLRRRPFLDLGVIPYAARPAASIVQYAFEGAPMPTPADDDKWTPEEEAQYSRIARYMAKKHPRLAAYMDGSAPSPTNQPPAAPYAAPTDAAQRIAAEAAAKAILSPLKGVVKFNEDREVKVLVSMPEADRAGHVQYMADTYQRVQAGDVKPIPVATGAAAPAVPVAEQQMSQAQMQAAIQYMSTANVPYEAARLWALSNIKG